MTLFAIIVKISLTHSVFCDLYLCKVQIVDKIILTWRRIKHCKKEERCIFCKDILFQQSDLILDGG